MKTFTGILLVFMFVIISSCEGPVGPVGPPGEDGINILGSVFEVVGDFTAENDYSLYTEFPNNIEVYASDIVLVYILWGQTENGQMDIWRLLPQSSVYDQGILQYNFDYTQTDVLIFMDGSYPSSLYLPGDTDNQVFRIAVLPADFVSKKSIDIGDFNAVMKSLQISPSAIQKSEIIIR